VRTRPLLPIALSLLALTAASCGGDDDSEASAGTPTVTEATVTEATVAMTETMAPDMTAPDTVAMEDVTAGTGADAPMEASVEIADFAFGPAEITIAAGGTVTWTNTDNQAHTATSSGNFDTGAIDPDATASVTFDEPGTYTYICSFHPFMTGTVTVV
jgi:plastocyanin